MMAKKIKKNTFDPELYETNKGMLSNVSLSGYVPPQTQQQAAANIKIPDKLTTPPPTPPSTQVTAGKGQAVITDAQGNQRIATPEDAQRGRAEIAGITGGMGAAQALEQSQVAEARGKRLQELMALGDQGILSPAELGALQEADIDWGQALTAGAARVLPGLAGGAAGGAALGLVGSGGVLSIPGAIIGGLAGAVTGMLSGVMGNIKTQQRGEIGAATDVLSQARSNLRQLRMIAETDPTRAEEAVKLYYDQISQVQRAHRQIQLETQGNLNKFMEDGTDILSDFELFLQPGGYADLQRMRLEQAIMKGQPATPEELLAIYQEEYLE